MAMTYRVIGLLSYTGYQFRIQAINALGAGEYSQPTQVVLTAESGRLLSVLPTKKMPNRGASTSETAVQGSQVAQFPFSSLKLH